MLPVAAHSQSKPAIAKPVAATEPKLAPNYGKLPLSFEANQGQIDPRVKFLSRGQGYSLFLTDKAAILSLSEVDPAKSGPNQSGCRIAGDRKPGCPILNDSSSVVQGGKARKPASAPLKTDTVRMELAGASPNLHIEGADQLPGIANYFLGKDPTKWHSNIPTYAKVKYSGVYPGVDLVYYGNQRQLEYDFVVAPGASPRPVKLHFAGAEKLKIDASGNLTVAARNGEIAFHKPVVYQEKASQRVGESGSQRELVDGQFVLLANNTVGFRLGSYDPSRELVIDPVLAYSTYLGGSGYYDGNSNGDSANAMAVDGEGNVYVTGVTWSADFPVTSNAFQQTNIAINVPYSDSNETQPEGTAFVTKLSASGSALIYSTFLGGSALSTASGIAVDDQGAAYITGTTFAGDFPVTKNAFQYVSHYQRIDFNGYFTQGTNGFVTKLDASGSSLVYSTYLGGSSSDSAAGIALDHDYNAYVTGLAQSPDFPVTSGAFQTVNHSTPSFFAVEMYPGNAFVAKLNSTGSALAYSTYIGGSTDSLGDQGFAIAVDKYGDAYAVGATNSTDFPVTTGALQTVNREPAGYRAQSGNGFFTEVNPSGSALMYSTYLGGSAGGDFAKGVAVDTSGNAYVTGQAQSTDFPVTRGAFQTVSAGGAPFVAKFDTSSSALLYSTYVGVDGYGGLGGAAIAVDSSGDAYITGSTGSTTFPITSDAYQEQANGQCADSYFGTNAFLAEVNASGSGLLYSTYLGGGKGRFCAGPSVTDAGSALAVDSLNNVYVAGVASSSDFPVTGSAFQVTNNTANASTNGFISKFDFNQSTTLSPTLTYVTSDIGKALVGETVTFLGHVQPTSGTSVVPDGKVRFLVDGVPTKDVTLAYSGHAIYYDNTLSPGMHTVVASYLGDGDGYSASSNRMVQFIMAQAAAPTFFPLGGTYRSAQHVALTTASAGSTIYYTTNGSIPTTSSTKYTGPIALSENGKINAIAVVSGATASAVSSASYKLVPSAIGSTTTLKSSANPSSLGEAVAFTATVIPNSGSYPTGSVSFRNGDVIFAVAPLVKGVASCGTSSLTLLGHNITAVYTGDATHAEKGSPVLRQEVNP